MCVCVFVFLEWIGRDDCCVLMLCPSGQLLGQGEVAGVVGVYVRGRATMTTKVHVKRGQAAGTCAHLLFEASRLSDLL